MKSLITSIALCALISVSGVVQAAPVPAFSGVYYNSIIQALVSSDGISASVQDYSWFRLFGDSSSPAVAGGTTNFKWSNETETSDGVSDRVEIDFFGGGTPSFVEPSVGSYSNLFEVPVVAAGWATLNVSLYPNSLTTSMLYNPSILASYDQGNTFTNLPVRSINLNGDGLSQQFNIAVNFDPVSLNGVDALKLEFSVKAVPIPAASWLLGSGLLGLIGVARRKAA